MKLYAISKLYCDITNISELRYRFAFYYSNAKHSLESIDEDVLTDILKTWQDHIVFVEPQENVTRVVFPNGATDKAITLKPAWEKLFPETVKSVGIDLVDGENLTFILGKSFSSKELLKTLKFAFKKADFSVKGTMQIAIDDLLELT